MSLENSLDAGQPVIDLDHLARECLEACLKAHKSVLEAGESGIHVRLEAGKPGPGGVMLQNPGKDVHHHREYGQTYRKIELSIVHASSLDYPRGPRVNVRCNMLATIVLSRVSRRFPSNV
jgi:hypothetical protein